MEAVRQEEQADLEPILSSDGPPIEPPRHDWYRTGTLILLGVIAAALVVLANAELRQARVAERRECREREMSRQAPFGPPVVESILERCGGEDGPARRSAIPDVVGTRLTEAEWRLREHGFFPQVQGGDPLGDDVVVWAQEPPGGQEVPGGTAVRLRTRR